MCCTYRRCLSTKLGFPDVGDKAYPGFSRLAIHAVPPAVMALGAMLGGTYAFLKRRSHCMLRAGCSADIEAHRPLTWSSNRSSTSC